ncbi:C40 family peptidase [Bradyrhizobium sp.]
MAEAAGPESKQVFRPYNARVSSGSTMLRHSPTELGEVESELLHGEPITVTGYLGDWLTAEAIFAGFVYKGFVRATDVTTAASEPTHKVVARLSPILAFPGLKAAAIHKLSYGALVSVIEEKDHHVRIWPDGWMYKKHLAGRDYKAADYVEAIEGLMGVPFVWGGRSPAGLDCSGMIEFGLRAAGIPCARRMVHLSTSLGTELPKGSRPARGDFLFYSGHCAMFVSDMEVINCNGLAGRVQVESFDELDDRMRNMRKYQFQSVRRLDERFRAGVQIAKRQAGAVPSPAALLHE